MALCSSGCGQEGLFYSKQTKRWRCTIHSSSCPAQQSHRKTVMKNKTDLTEKQRAGVRKKYGVDNVMHLPEIKEKQKETVNNKSIEEKSLIIEKRKESMMEIYGVDNPSKSEIIKDKKKITLMKNYGVDNPSKSEIIKDKKKATCMVHYGVEYPMHVKEIIEKVTANRDEVENLRKRTATNLKKYGVENVSQVSEIRDKAVKNSYKRKIYITPSGKEVNIQGYEPIVLNHLLVVDLINENDILISDVEKPQIWYNFNNKNHRYYPDFYIKSQNKIIEVKSEYTYQTKKDINEAKKQACLNQNYLFEFWIIRNDSVIDVI